MIRKISSAVRFTPWLCLLLSTTLLSRCSKGDEQESGFLSDSTHITAGRVAFEQHCSACHNFRQDGIGPQLAGITDEVSSNYLVSFVNNPQKMIESGEERAMKLHEKYRTIMPSFEYLGEEQLLAIAAYLHTQKKSSFPVAEVPDNFLENPIPEPIPTSDLVLDIELISRIPFSSEQMPRTRITKLWFEPGTNRPFVVDLRGKMYLLNDNKPMVYFDMAKARPQFIHQPGLATGFGSFAFHPEFAKNGLLYTSHTEPAGTARADFAYADSMKVTLQWVLTEWKTDSPGQIPFAGEGRELFRIDMVTGIHGMQELTFNPLARHGDPDFGLLYVGVGDGGGVERGFSFLVSGYDAVWGTVLRIDPAGNNSANGQYGIPEINPFSKSNPHKKHGEIYAFGFRNPHRFTWLKTGELLVANIGQHNAESLYMIEPGSNCGWPTREGTFVIDAAGDLKYVFPLPANDDVHKINYPVVQFDHDEGSAITGGYVYEGTRIPELQGKFFFGDIVSGGLFFVEAEDIRQGSQAPIQRFRVSLDDEERTFEDITGSARVDLRFSRDTYGELYMLTKADGKIYHVVGAHTDPI